jgi:hypothetical protein
MRYLALCFFVLLSSFTSAATLNIQEFEYVDTEYILPGTEKSMFSFVASPNGTATFNYIELIEANDKDLSSVINTVELRVSPNTDISAECTKSTSKIVCSGFTEKLTDKKTYRFNIDYLTTDVATYTYKIGSANVTGYPTEESVSVNIVSQELDILPIALRYDGDVQSAIVFDNGTAVVDAAEGMEHVPVASFKLKAVNATFNIQEFTVKNSHSMFHKEEKGVTTIKVYAETSTPDAKFKADELDATANSLIAYTENSDNLSLQSSIDVDVTANDTGFLIPNGDTKQFYVFYDLGTGSGGNSVDFELGDVVATFNNEVLEITPVSLNATGTVTKTASGFSIKENPVILFTKMRQLNPSVNNNVELTEYNNQFATEDTTLMAGMYNVVFYSSSVDVKNSVTSMNITLSAIEDVFNHHHEGILSVAVYLDNPSIGTREALDKEDTLLAITNAQSGEDTLTLSGISLEFGSNQTLLFVIELGQQADKGKDVGFYISDVTVMEGDNTGVGIVTPFPHQMKSYNVAPPMLILDSITQLNPTQNPFSLNVSISKNDNFEFSDSFKFLPSSIPKFYLSKIEGEDRSYEFTSVPDELCFDDVDVTSKICEFTVSSNVSYSGNYVIDFDAVYFIKSGEIGGDETFEGESFLARRTRHLGSGGTYFAATQYPTGASIAVKKTYQDQSQRSFSGFLPGYIASINVRESDIERSFSNYDSVKQGAELLIHFYNQGFDIDLSTLTWEFVKENVSGEVSAQSFSYEDSAAQFFSYQALEPAALLIKEDGSEYNPFSAILEIDTEGLDGKGVITITASDSFGNPHDSAEIIFYSSASLSANQFRVYPNPYSPSLHGTKLSFGVSLTKAADVVIYIYDATGREVTRTENIDCNAVEYCFISDKDVLVRDKALFSGTYFLRMVATDVDGKKVHATTKLAVY